MKNYILQISTILFAGVIFSACIKSPAETEVLAPEVMPEETPVVMESESPEMTDSAAMITLETIAMHDTPEDCWFAVEGKVYDVSPYIASGKHPGDEAILLGCGKDATEMFNSRPGDGTSHSEKARSFLPTFQIGELSQ